MPANLTVVINNLVNGDFRQVPWSVSGIPTNGQATKAWMTVKENETDLDAAAVFQKIATTVLDLDEGHITSTGDGTGVATGFFNVIMADSALLLPSTPYYFDIQLLIAMADLSSRIETPIKGTITTIQGITDAIS